MSCPAVRYAGSVQIVCGRKGAPLSGGVGELGPHERGDRGAATRQRAPRQQQMCVQR
jgi:hypothetical protein